MCFLSTVVYFHDMVQFYPSLNYFFLVLNILIYINNFNTKED